MLAFKLISYLAFAIFAAILGYQALDITGMAMVYPMVLVVLVLVGSLGTFAVTAIWRQPIVASADAAHLATARGPELTRLLSFCLLWVCYPVALPIAGFLVSTILAMTISFWLLKMGRPIVGFFGAVVFALALSVLFATVFYIPVPQGVVDTWLTEYLYTLTG
ncbi:tripartite tricarboxylate transporter TctB family protein [Rhizobium halophytocola]|uniref:Antibiotic biosynthesis monooxygenase (ABM) superfamily enzyme n=1 Tax=Rhizobium halophytocola TaxID=735519 RepID=A0ABS4DUB0_9HYPH|nr:tripartite tricarboxylate transporter TctB family protein [Rhizobium halophytocola]MBP1849265.1 antibiotic biosynthesis monooxygenase (ABM) superfamily enzyme [Rhizobium halophytocola]